MTNEKIFIGNQATGFTTTQNGISFTTHSEEAARRQGTIANAVPTWAKCCGWGKR
jgi:hypothetical protein